MADISVAGIGGRRMDRRAAPAGPPRPAIYDVWSRSGAKYRVRAVVLLAVNILLFGGLGCFAFWLRTGYYFAPAIENYWGVFWHTCQPGGETLTRLLTFPISWEAVPLQIVIHGLLLSALVAIPILVSILYRFPSCLPFILIVTFIAMMPWLGLTLVGSCLVASWKRFRISFRYVSALLGLTLVVLYIFIVLRQAWPSPELLSNPGDRVKLVAPWILAIVAACVLLALGLGLARVVNYRPGAIAPLMTVMFALPVALFEQHVGRDELHYRLLEHSFGPASAYFRNQDVTGDVESEVGPPELPAAAAAAVPPEAAGIDEIRWQIEQAGEHDRYAAFTRHQLQAARDCDWFLRQFPDSRYAPAVLFLKGRALDMRLDLPKYRKEKQLLFYDTFPSDASEPIWRRLLKNAPRESALCAEALLRLALLEARRGEMEEAGRMLDRLITDFAGRAPTTQTQAGPSLRGMLRKLPPETSLQVPIDRLLFEARRWRGIITENRDPLYEYDPLWGGKRPRDDDRVGWLLLDPNSEFYVSNLRLLLERFPNCKLSDNFSVEIARQLPPEEQIVELQRCIARFSDGDAIPEALFRLGRACLQAERPDEARAALERLGPESDFASSIWGEPARRLLAVLQPAQPPGA